MKIQYFVECYEKIILIHLPNNKLFDYQTRHPDRRFYIGYTVDELPFAFGEIIPQESGYSRLARILVGKSILRGQGLGRYFIGLLLEESKRLYHTSSVELFTWEKNYAAIRCYENAVKHGISQKATDGKITIILSSIYKENRFTLDIQSTRSGTKISLVLTDWL